MILESRKKRLKIDINIDLFKCQDNCLLFRINIFSKKLNFK